jgi:hypothetical protein
MAAWARRDPPLPEPLRHGPESYATSRNSSGFHRRLHRGVSSMVRLPRSSGRSNPTPGPFTTHIRE